MEQVIADFLSLFNETYMAALVLIGQARVAALALVRAKAIKGVGWLHTLAESLSGRFLEPK